MGACAAVALKRVSREAAYVVGLAFAGLQVLSYLGYIQINYSKLNADAQKALDVTGDGKFNAEDVKLLSSRLLDILKHGLPAAGGFSSGFALGFYYI
jgi:uncharacterized membrane protein (Fun14 family)